MVEKWLPVVGHEGLYAISTTGRLWSLRKSRALRQRPSGCGYLYGALHADGAVKYRGLHVLVCEAFNGQKPTPTHEVRHLDGNPTNNTPDNLVWGTGKENAADRILHGTDGRGVKHSGVKLTEADVLRIRALLRNTTARQKDIAAMFGVTPSNISCIGRGVSWPLLPGARQPKTRNPTPVLVRPLEAA